MAWQRVVLVVAAAHAEPLADAMQAQGAISVELADADAGSGAERSVFDEAGLGVAPWARCRVSALFPIETDASRALERALAAAHCPAPVAAAINRLEDADWVAETQRQFDPIHAGDRLWIVPTWHRPPQPDAINIILDPGAAFGTGSHPTTRLCLAWLERHVRTGDLVLDYGCGSGILAIAALKLGAGRAIGVDIDPLAFQAARYNAERNAVALELVPAQQPLRDCARITVANILANPLRMLAPVLAAHTAVGGEIALSGILAEQADDVARAYSPWCTLEVEASESGWVLLAGTRRL